MIDEISELLGDVIGSKPLVLVVDDEENYLELLKFNLTQAGFDVDTAINGEEALTSISRRKPACILLDGLLPKIHGFEVCRRIKSQPDTKDIPVIIMTAVYKALRYKYEVKGDYGADDFITKPFDVEDIIARIRNLI
jgi:two-component system phosphate regulon response regulator PhoB